MNTGSVFRRMIGLTALGVGLAIAAPAQAQADPEMSKLASACQAGRVSGGVAGYASGNDGSTWRSVITFPGALSEAHKASVKLWVDGRLLPLQFKSGNLFTMTGGPASSPGVKSARVVCGAVPDPASVPSGAQLVNEGQGFVSAAFDVVYLPDHTFQSLTVSPAAEDGSYTIDLVMKLDTAVYKDTISISEQLWEDHSSDGWSVSQSAVKAVQIREGTPPFGETNSYYMYLYRITVEAGGAGGPLKLTVPGSIIGPGRTEPVSFNFTAPPIAATPSYVLELYIRTSEAEPMTTFPDGSIGWIRIGRDYIGDQEEWKMENKLPGFSLETMCRIGGADQEWTGKSSGSNLWGGCGSPNSELNIEGVAMRLTGPEASKYTIAVICDVTGSGPMTVADGVLCGPPSPGGGLQSVSATITSRP